jgi:hypothetical protein
MTRPGPLEIGGGFVVGSEAVKRRKNPAEFKDYLKSLLEGTGKIKIHGKLWCFFVIKG